MAVQAWFYGLGMKDMVCTGTINLQQGNIYAMLVNGTYSPTTWNQDTDHYRSSVTGELPTGSGYTYGGTVVPASTVTYDAGSNEVRWDFDNPTWTSATFSATGMVVYQKNGGTSSADPLLMFVDFGGTQTVSSGTFSYTVPVTGAGAITVS